MPREAKLFSSSSSSAVRGFLNFRANIPPRWIGSARTSRKRVEPEIVRNLRPLKQLRKSASRASCHKRCTQGTESSVTTLGGGVQQGEFLSWNTNPFGAATEWVVEAVDARP